MPITINYNRAAIVLLPFPFSDLTAAKLRPAVVASPTFSSDDLIVVALTSVGDALRPGEFRIHSWREAGLLHPSFAKRALASVSGHLVHKPLGGLGKHDLAQLDDALRLWLGF